MQVIEAIYFAKIQTSTASSSGKKMTACLTIGVALANKIIITTNRRKTMTTNEIKKGMKVRTTQLGAPVTGVMLDSLKGNTRLIETKGSEVGLFDEMGSVYSYDIVAAEVDGEWIPIEHTEKQLKLKATVSQMWG
tara:strand:- start:115 stop:519 length:405 start_codon:yes stop_codon:yes gene_type:complete